MFYNGLAHTQFSTQSLSGSLKRRTGGSSERLELAVHNFYFVPIELSHNEAVEPLIVGAAIVSQEPQGLLFADEKAAHAVGTVMNAGGITTKCNIAGEFVDLVAEGEVSAVPRFQRRAVRRRLDRVQQHVIGIEERL